MVANARWSAALAVLFMIGSVAGQSDQVAEAALTKAKLLETRGEFAAAEQALREALKDVPAGAQPTLTAALRELLRRQGRVREANELTPAVLGTSVMATPGDPVVLLIAQLDRGTFADNDEVKKASRQLESLGVLATPALLAALPQLGPFGISNALSLLNPEHPAVMAALLARLDAGDRSMALVLAERIRSYPAGVALELARKLRHRAPETRITILPTLVWAAPMDPETQQLATELAADPIQDTQIAALTALYHTKTMWARELLEKAIGHPDTKVRWLALNRWLSVLRDDEEDVALAMARRIPEDQLAWLIRSVAEERSGWARLASMILQHVDARSDWPDVAKLLQKVRWTNAPEASGRAILAAAKHADVAMDAKRALQGLLLHDWVPPSDSDDDLLAADLVLFEQGSTSRLALICLPPDAEDRALGLMAKMPAPQREAFAVKAAEQRPAWHRVAATLLDPVSPRTITLLRRDWTGAPPEVLTQLQRLAASGNTSLADSLYVAFASSRDLPVAVALPLLTSKWGADLVQSLGARDPRAVLDFLRTATPLTQPVAAQALRLLARSGTTDDLPLALRMVRELDFMIVGDGNRRELAAFIVQWGQGNLDVLQLARVPARAIETVWQSCLGVAIGVAEGVQAADIEAALALAPALPLVVAETLLRHLASFAGPAHVGLLTRIVEQAVVEPLTLGPMTNEAMRVSGMGSAYLLASVVPMLRNTGDPSALPALKRVLALDVPSGSDGLADSVRNTIFAAAEAALHVAGANRRQVLEELLAAAQPDVVRAAVQAPESATEPDLLPRVRAALVRVGDRLRDVAPFFARLAPATALAVATELVTHERFPQFSVDLATAALVAIGDHKDPAQIPHLTRGAKHPAAIVRQAAAQQLGRTFSRDAGPALLDLLKDDDGNVSKQAQAQIDGIVRYLEARAQFEAKLK